ncbi:MAG: DUF4301 family protein [Bacteroidales bacterium]|nr:DUF4301 family protein [Bacteroidales bacterium]
MFSKEDELQINRRGSDLSNVQRQIENYKHGFPFLEISEPAVAGNGIIALDNKDLEEDCERYDREVSKGLKCIKFVPASGAATRMFKALFEVLKDCGHDNDIVLARSATARKFLANKQKFAFYEDLKKIIGQGPDSDSCRTWIEFLLNEKGLNYGLLPKGVIKFHKYPDGSRTPFEEHLVEGVGYVRDHSDVVRIHFTVSPAHLEIFNNLFYKVRQYFEQKYRVKYDVTFSLQKPKTDVIAVSLNNEVYREPDGSLLFRPGGHGALIENLNDLDADIIFIKNIDNVVPDRLKDLTIRYKKALGGVLLRIQEKLFRYQKYLNERHHATVESAFLAEAANFLENILYTKPSENQYYTEKENLYHYLKDKFNRPLRVCGMVKNQGEPGGGPFWAKNPDGTLSLQIVESVQVDPESVKQQTILKSSTHFNPVDIVCSVKNYKGIKYDLTKFTDPATGFISKKSKDGRELKAQELPGLWNGAMSDWNTIFVEVPVETFNPVKTIKDLLRDQHL